MSGIELLHKCISKSCPNIHAKRLASLIDISESAVTSGAISQVSVARNLRGESRCKHKIKKVNRLHRNAHIYSELSDLYGAISGFIFNNISSTDEISIVLDLCFVRDDRLVQMLSAELVHKGRSIPIYRDVFSEGNLKNRAKPFVHALKRIIPKNKNVVVIMDAGFFEQWFDAIESVGWHWICRTRKGRSVFDVDNNSWLSFTKWASKAGTKAKDHGEILLTRRHKRRCRLVSLKKTSRGRHYKTRRGRETSCIASKAHSNAANEPWLLAHNFSGSVKPKKIVELYGKRMQIEESFRDMKNYRNGLAARSIGHCTIRSWSVSMLIATIVQIMYILIGEKAYEKNIQHYFQSNTAKTNRVFSLFELGKLVVQFAYGQPSRGRSKSLHAICLEAI